VEVHLCWKSKLFPKAEAVPHLLRVVVRISQEREKLNEKNVISLNWKKKMTFPTKTYCESFFGFYCGLYFQYRRRWII